MLKKPLPEQTALEIVSLDGLVPKDHLLRKIEAVIDFSLIHDRVAGLFCPDNGRPALDPTLMFKALFIGYLFGVRSERQLVREIEVNVAYRWFLGLKLMDPVFDASTLSQNRRRRYDDTTVAQDIFDAIVEQAIRHGLVDGMVLYTESTHLKANANKNRYDLAVVAKSRADYWDALDAAIEDDRAAHGKKPLKDKPREPVAKETKVCAPIRTAATWCATASRRASSTSTTAPSMGGSVSSPTHMRRPPTCMTSSFISGASTASANASASMSVPSAWTPATRPLASPRAWRTRHSGRHRLSAADAAKTRHDAAQGLPLRSGRRWIRCPQGQLLAYATTDRTGYRHYKSDPAICKACPLLASCTSNAGATRLIVRHVWADARERADAHRLTPWGKGIYKRRKETVERSFADAKQLHGHRYGASVARRGRLPVPARRRRPEH